MSIKADQKAQLCVCFSWLVSYPFVRLACLLCNRAPIHGHRQCGHIDLHMHVLVCETVLIANLTHSGRVQGNVNLHMHLESRDWVAFEFTAKWGHYKSVE